MKLLLVHTKAFSYSPNGQAPHTEETDPGLDARDSYTNSLVVFTAVEDRDSSATVGKASRHLARFLDSIEPRPSSLVIFPNAHLSFDVEPRASHVISLLHEMHASLSALVSDATVHLEPFGFTGSWEIRAEEHAQSVVGRRFGG